MSVNPSPPVEPEANPLPAQVDQAPDASSTILPAQAAVEKVNPDPEEFEKRVKKVYWGFFVAFFTVLHVMLNVFLQVYPRNSCLAKN